MTSISPSIASSFGTPQYLPSFSNWWRWLSVQPKTAWNASWMQHRGIVLGTWIRRQIGGSISRRVIFSWKTDGLGLAVGIRHIVLQKRVTTAVGCSGTSATSSHTHRYPPIANNRSEEHTSELQSLR